MTTLDNDLQWNGRKHWNFSVFSDSANVFMLRDHISLMIDLLEDWTWGPPVDELYFIPCSFSYQIKMNQPKIYLCANEHNVIDQPNDFTDNSRHLPNLRSM